MQAKYLEELSAGDTFLSPARTITETDVVGFAGLSGDFNPIHTDVEFALSTVYGQRVVYGLLGLAILTGLLDRLPTEAELATARCLFASVIDAPGGLRATSSHCANVCVPRTSASGSVSAPVRKARPSLPGMIRSVSHDSLLHQEVSLIGTCLGGHRGTIWVTSMWPWRQTGHCHNEEPVSSS